MNINCPHCGTEYDIEQREFGKYVTCQVCGKGFVAGARQTRAQMVRPDNFARPSFSFFRNSVNAETSEQVDVPPESACLKAWAKYWFARLLIAFVVSFVLGFLGGFVGSLTGCAPFADWPEDFPERMAHIVVYAACIVGIYLSWRLAWWGYKRFAVGNLLPELSASNMRSSGMIPIFVNIALSLLMPMGLQIAALGVYGYIVWAFTIWIVVDYLMFRFISVNLLCGKEIDTRWICPAILFCIFIVVMYGFARIVENDDIRHHDASPVYDRSKQMDNSHHHDAEQIFDRMGRKIYMILLAS